MGTELQTEGFNTERLTRVLVRDGVQGNYDVLYQMIRLIRDSIYYDKGLEAVAAAILKNNHLDSYSPASEQLKAIYDFVKANVAYKLDISGRVEHIKSARTTLSTGYGDCDDITILCASLAGCIGFEDIRVAMSRYSQAEASFTHVYCVVYRDNKRYVLDATLPLNQGQFNTEVKPFEVKEINIFDDVPGLDGFSGLFNNARYQARKFGRAAVEVIPTATAFLPLGFIPGNAIATGANLIGQSGKEKLSIGAVGAHIHKELDKIIVDLLQSRVALDLANAMALQAVAQLNAVEVAARDYDVYITVKKGITEKLKFIKNFETYAKDNGIKVVYLDSQKMLAAGLGLAGIGAYIFYKKYRGN